ncbi:MAG TPA: RHS repeat-associated core domain-containing protein [Pseudoxanthomonas sp.]
MKRIATAIVLLGLTWTAQAQTGKFAWEGFDQRLKASQSVTPLGPDFAGDQVSLSNGALSFAATDVSLPGNDGLSVAFARSFDVKNRKQYGSQEMLADWTVEVPQISGVFPGDWVVQGATPGNRCSSPGSPPIPPGGFLLRDFWQGLTMNLPGGGGGDMLVSSAATVPTSGGPYPWTVDNGMTHVSCLSSILNGTGQGYLAITADGTRYWFNWMARYNEPGMRGRSNWDVIGAGTYTVVPRYRNVLYATRVEDRFGNWVAYTYTNASNQPGKLTRIEAGDGRVLTATYSGNYISSVSDGTRTWSYTYGDAAGSRKTLTSVTLPDGSAWNIGFAAFAAAEIKVNESPQGEPLRECTLNEMPINMYEPPPVASITHPAGATATFTATILEHGRSHVPVACGNVTTSPVGAAPGTNNNTQDDVNTFAISAYSFTLTKKAVSGPGLTAAEWNYSYDPQIGVRYRGGATMQYPVCNWGSFDCAGAPCTSDDCAGSSKTTVTGPGNEWTRYSYGNTYLYNEGKLLKVERGTGPGNVLDTVTKTYDLTRVNQVYPARFGTSLRGNGDGFQSEFHRPLKTSATVRDGASFNYSVTAFDAFARPVNVDKWSGGMAANFGRTDVTEYYDNFNKWVLGQVSKVTNANTSIVASQTNYDASTAMPVQTYSFGKLQQTLTYDTTSTIASGQLGTLKTVADGNNNVTTLSGWKRGIPQSIKYPATSESPTGATQLAAVNNNGWITSVTDENEFTTSYGYDAMGRMASIVYPTGDSTVWTATIQNFIQINYDEHGLAPGHWRSSRATGNGYLNVYYDAMWRPVLEEKLDLGNIGGTVSQVVKRYDASGRLAFQSYPVNNVANFQSVTQGTRTFYDALDRITRVEQDSELGVLASTTEYLTGFQTRVTNPRTLQTTTTYKAYDTPSFDLPVTIQEPEGRNTAIARDVFGKPASITRSGGGVSVTRSYVYDGAQQLCKTIEPETGATIIGFDAAGNLTWSAAGLDYPNTATCEQAAAYVSGRTVLRTYDARNRLSTLAFPDGRGNQSWSYTPDGLPAQITTGNETGGGGQVINAYSYNKRRMLTGESVQQPGWYTWGIGYGYDGNGNLASQTYPTGLAINYAPNALGQPTQAGSYATAVQYYPNGAIKQFTYGNGLVHTMQQNARQLPSQSIDTGNALNHQYTYDPNANVSAIYDNVIGTPTAQHRYMAYDGLDRLTGAGSAMFGGSDHWHFFTYDALDNLKSWKQAGLKDYAEYLYDAKNQLVNIKNTAGATVVGLGYDVQGNLANKNGQLYDFTYGNRLRAVPNKEAYLYDGHGRRVQTTKIDGSKTLWQYGQSGQMLFSWNGPTSEKTHENIYLGGSLVATVDHDWPSNAVIATKYQHTDALGSPVAVTDAAGAVIDRTNYEPYGAAINEPAYDGIGYTGHVQDGATGLTYMQQRYYDPMCGCFLSVDPVAADPNTGAHFNRYSYANNNPYKFTDPDGRKARDVRSICGDNPARCKGVIQVNPKGQGMLAQNGRSKTTDATVPSPLPSPQVTSGNSESSAWDDFSRSHCGGNCWDAFEHDVLMAIPGEGQMYAGGLRLLTRFERFSGFTYTKTAAAHAGERLADGRLVRPFYNSPLLIREIMASSKPVVEASGALRWNIPGTFRGSEGVWELVIKMNERKIYHFNFTTK